MTIQKYEPNKIEAKWQQKWEKSQLYRSEVDWERPKHYALTMLPYPSGDLHMGHWFAMTPSDARARFMRMRGYNVLFPMGFDAFGLPAENAAVQRNIHPYTWTYANMENMRKQLRSMGAMFDWEREAVSCEPSYYKWTEWFFKKFFEGDLAYKGEAMVNWSPTLQTVLANEQVIDGKDERTGQPVVQKLMSQWFFRITHYADELLSFEGMDWPEPIKLMQTNWIGRSEGARVTFTADTPNKEPIEIFTTRPDTLWGATFMVLSPEHQLVAKVTTTEQRAEVEGYQAAAARQSEFERTAENKEKTGVFTGGYAINPVNQERIPIWIADYVLMNYGTGAIMAVPAHDQRDFEFARQFGLTIAPVFQPEGVEFSGETMEEAYIGPGTIVNSGPINGIAVNTEKGRKNPAIAATIDWLEEKKVGEEAINYRLRDWLISRQRYWGSPIPMVYTIDGEVVPVADVDLPVVLPEDVDFDPSGRSPLNDHEEFVHTEDEQGRPARRETDTMDTFMCSSWYQLRYLSPSFDGGPFDPEEAAYWLPVDVYTGGAEHATMHLLYTRFFTKAMRDLEMFEKAGEIAAAHGREVDGLFDEPMVKLRNQGQILGEERVGDQLVINGRWEDDKLIASQVEVVDEIAVPANFDGVAGELMRRTENILHVQAGSGQPTVVEVPETAVVTIPAIPGENSVNQLKHHLEIQRMSKSKGNVVNPDELVAKYGADTVRGYIMFAFDWEKGGPWNSQGIAGFTRFLDDVWQLAQADYAPKQEKGNGTRDLRRATHQAIQKVTQEMENFSFNTAVATLMGMRNTLKEAQKKGEAARSAWDEAIDRLLLMLAPISPHISEELWALRGNGYSVHTQAWPEADPEVAKDEVITLIVQVNGKVRGRLEVPADISQADAKAQALALENVQSRLNGNEPKKVIVIPGRLVNIVV